MFRLATCSIALAMLSAAFGITAVSGCKAKPAKDAGFTDAKLMAKDPMLPFQKVWEKKGLDWNRYKSVYVQPVNTSYMLKATDWQKGERKDEIEKDVAKLGIYTENEIKKAFQADKHKRYTIVDSRPTRADALIFEMAIIEVVPSKVTLNALGFAPFYVGTAIAAVRGIGGDVSSVAFEARVRDAATGEVIAMYADREQEQSSLVTVRGLTWYSHTETIIRQWSQQFVEVTSRKPGQKVKDTDAFTLQPW